MRFPSSLRAPGAPSAAALGRATAIVALSLGLAACSGWSPCKYPCIPDEPSEAPPDPCKRRCARPYTPTPAPPCPAPDDGGRRP